MNKSKVKNWSVSNPEQVVKRWEGLRRRVDFFYTGSDLQKVVGIVKQMVWNFSVHSASKLSRQLVSILDDVRHSNWARPIVVEIAQLLREGLNFQRGFLRSKGKIVS